jgi:hypothetical protein
MIRVKATREGLAGGKTSSGYLIDNIVPFVALPTAAALRQWVVVRNPANGRSCTALVLDVGPWNVNDNAYVFQELTKPRSSQTIVKAQVEVRPAAESGKSVSGQGTNNAGIDLGEKVWKELGMLDNADVEWEFI